MIDFSIIIPHFNTAILLKRLLESISIGEDTEVIVVDDNSTKMLEEYEKLKYRYEALGVKFFENDTGKNGAGICRNIGLKNALGKWIIFADSDDYFTSDFRRIITENKDRTEDVIFYYPTSVDSDTGVISDRHTEFVFMLDAYRNNPDRGNELKLRFSLVAPWAKMIKRSLINENSIDFEDSKVANDVLFCRKLGVFAKKIAVGKR